MRKVEGNVSFKLVYSLGEHPYLGYILEPHIIYLNPNGSYSLGYRRVFSATIDDFASAVDETDREIIRILDETEQTHLIKQYNKKAMRAIDFFTKVFDERAYNTLRPKIEQRMLRVLKMLADKPLFLMGKDGYPADQALQIADEPSSILFHFRRNDVETRYFPTLKYKGNRLDFMYKDSQVVVNKEAWLLLENTLHYFEDGIDGKKLSPFLNKRYIAVPRSTEKKYFETFVKGLIEKHHVYAEGFIIQTVREQAKPILQFYYVESGQSFVQLLFDYGPYRFHYGTDHPVTVQMEHNEDQDEYVFYRIRRSLLWEEKQAAYLKDKGLLKKDPLFGSFVLPDHQGTIIDWLNKNQENILDNGYQIIQAKGTKPIFIGRTSLEITVEEQSDWFDIKAVACFGDYTIPFIELREHILHKIREFILPNGEIAILPDEWFAQYEHLFQFALQKNELTLSKSHIGLLYEISEHTQIAFNRRLQKLLDFNHIEEAPMPAHFVGQLRPYQKAGYNWFHFLQSYNFGGCLADDMGLGKTVQTLALLQKQKEALHGSDHTQTSLLILPTSLIYNWQKEAERFAPQLRILRHTGSNRLKDPFGFSHFDLVITTYGIVRGDIELFSKFFFNYIVLDESQQIKNPSSKAFKAIKSLKSRYKLALSGTPIENTVADIWSQMHFANPGLLGSYTYFQKEFVIPIEKKKDEDKAARLQAIIKPFVLRRTKDQVATELPPKTEQVVFCDMTDEQYEKYESIKSEYRNALLNNSLKEAGAKNQIILLQGLTKLRQAANHPKMLDEEAHISSGKFQAAIEMLESIIAEGHKVLIFSQFVKHLQLFRVYFEETKISYAYLDGATRDRSAAVNTFKEDSSVQVFLISIKAGGVGLNLTEADYVFVLDPWWNPAVEQQAIDRAHRIGQTKNVFIYKFISKDTVEEKILALQNRKKEYSAALITTEESFVKSLSPDDIQELLR
ncbi:SNF2-related protein [Sphingobacterium sp. UT-1RO-CII-1]|uniref:DEAD/DEAH box helicase n=1 Tax=Sphingobacterium sp. UT-1RO-CII-1 TaxID=2995225 RepID=UPI00227AAFA2|nr:SNF2-related protein [Sphingobacterium sp. UT-1RO-CII-1]MCY4780826.1 SNF2-related protein [Sphingobacterium sp. UT-1RO-CII-1]